MQIALVLCALVALTVALPKPATVQTGEFASQKLNSRLEGIRETEVEEVEELPEERLYRGTFYTQRDHTRPQSRDLALFTYFANLDFYTEGNAFYVYIKDAGEHDNRRIEEGLMVDIAAQTGAALFTFNQRFFAENQVSNDTSFANLQFLSIEQSLADIAAFIEDIQNAHNGGNDAQVILWGSGYGATLAAWARKRYPHYVDAVWSSSGTYNIEPFTFSQYDLLSYVLHEQGSPECQQSVQAAFRIVEELVRSGEGEYISERLNLCTPVDTDSPNDIGAVFQSHVLAILAFIDQFHAAGVIDFCNDMQHLPADPLNSFARWKSHVYGHDLECFDYSYASLVERNSQVELDAPAVVSGRRQWYYLQCTQLGLFSVTDDTTWLPNGQTPEYHLDKCRDIFGEEYSAILQQPAVRDLAIQFGSLDQRITNIFYTNGAIDPWLHNGMLATRDVNATVTLIAGSAKSADLGSLSSYDPPQLVEAKRAIESQIILWSAVEQ